MTSLVLRHYMCVYFMATGSVKCEVYYNGHYVSSGGGDSILQLTVQKTGARHVYIEPRTLAVPYAEMAQLRCSYETNDDDYLAAAVAKTEASWVWLINGHPSNNTGQY